MDISHITTLPEIKKFLENSRELAFKQDENIPKKQTYEWLIEVLNRTKYQRLQSRKDKGLIKKFIGIITGYSRVQSKRLIAKHKQGKLRWTAWQKNEVKRIYNAEDIALLHGVDEVHQLAGPATKRILQREHDFYGDSEYENIRKISVSHLYNVRKSPAYIRQGRVFQKTKFNACPIGIRKKPIPNGSPGYFRVDTVHQGDKEGEKGVYFINAVDEVTQFEFVFCVPAISEKYMKKVLQSLMNFCPFVILNFHSDNGSEFINKVVADLLNEALIPQTKSRPRRHNDNALVECKNGSIIRKHFGYAHIPATERNAQLLNGFCMYHLNFYLNYHRPCGYAVTTVDKKGKEKKVYSGYQTPYEKLKMLPNAEQYLKPKISFENLDKVARTMSDTKFARQMLKQKATIYLHLEF
jgi:transposase InsO family protein